MSLTADERDHYRREGYVLVRELIDTGTLERIDDRFQALATGAAAAPESMVVMRDVAFVKGDATPESPLHAVNKILSFENDPVLWPFATDARAIAPLSRNRLSKDFVGPVNWTSNV